jgi:hypothetical protein
VPPEPSPGAGATEPAPHDRAGRDAGLGLTILATGYVIMSLTDGVAKILTADIAPGEIAWARYFFRESWRHPSSLPPPAGGASSPARSSAIWCAASSPHQARP